MIQFILLDIEGTTTSIAFVHEVLFPYASQHLETYVRDHLEEEKVVTALESVQKTILEETGQRVDQQGAIQGLLDWIKADRKHPALKNLQGYLWKAGYETGQYQGHIYPDVLPALERWSAAGMGMGIYSSGSVGAQKLLFGYSEVGDLNTFFSAYFDTQVGHKRAEESYRQIQKELALPSQSILFLSDVEEELDAAKAAGLETMQLVRPGTIKSEKHHSVENFDSILN